MGWKWSVALVQTVHEGLLQDLVPDLEYIADKLPSAPFAADGSAPKVMAYIDDRSVM